MKQTPTGLSKDQTIAMPEAQTEIKRFLSARKDSLTQSLLLQDAAQSILALTKEDPAREGLQKTPQRFAKAFEFLLSGYDKSAEQVVGEGIFPSESSGLVLVSNVEFYSLCEHHLLPFWGHATVAYFPSDKILGLSKIPRLIDLYARRVQVQERLTEQIAGAIEHLIAPQAVFVKVTAQHLCMMMRGVEKQASSTTTHVLRRYDFLNETQKLQLQKIL